MRWTFVRTKFFVGIIVVLLILSLNIFSAETREFFFSVSSPVQIFLWNFGNGASDFFSGLFRGGVLRRENQLLVEENIVLTQKLVGLEQLHAENTELRMALHLGLAEEFTFVHASVIGKNIGEDTIQIRGGEAQGILPGMAAITPSKAVVGKVIEVLGKVSTIRLLSHEQSVADVEILGGRARGVVRGRENARILLDSVSHEENLQEGEILVTSNLGGVFPQGFLVGTIKEIVPSAAEPFQKANVEPFFDLGSLKAVLIIIP